MTQMAIDPALSFGLNFNSGDLRANQQGRITSRQVRLLRDKRRQQTQSQSLSKRLAGGIFYLIYGVTPHKHQWNLVGADITATMTKQQQGQVRLPSVSPIKDKGLPNKIYQIVVNRESYKVDRRALNSFQSAREYIVYYAPHSRYALSAESD